MVILLHFALCTFPLPQEEEKSAPEAGNPHADVLNTFPEGEEAKTSLLEEVRRRAKGAFQVRVSVGKSDRAWYLCENQK